MEIEKLNENKIRVTLNTNDLTERNIDSHSFMANPLESQKIFLDMLHRAEKEVGFFINDCKLMIEALALKDGSFILTITKVPDKEQTLLPAFSKSNNSTKRKTLHIKRKSPKFSANKMIYLFENFDTFYDFCVFLSKSNYTNKLQDITSSVYLYEYNSNYYLVLNDINPDSSILDFILHTTTEFAHFVQNPELFERKISEYGKPIIKNTSLSDCIKHFV